jgi:hypothetical protein
MNHAFGFAGFMAVFLLIASPALAGQELGPATPQSAPGEFSLGAGYCYHTSWWTTSGNDGIISDVRQNIWYGSLAYGFAANWEGYLRAGAIDVMSKRASGCTWARFVIPSCLLTRLETGFEPYVSLGVRGAFYGRPDFAVGACVQFNYYSDGRAEQCGTEWTFDGYVDYEAIVYFKDRYDLSVGLNLDLIGTWGLFYASILYNKAAGKASGRLEYKVEPIEVYPFSADIEEEGNMGANAGLRVIVRKGWYLTIEGQSKLYKTMAAVSLSLNKALGL